MTIRRVVLPFLVSRDGAFDRKRNSIRVIKSARSRTRSHVRAYIRSNGLQNDGDPPEYAALTLGMVARLGLNFGDSNHRPRGPHHLIFALHPVIEALVTVGWIAGYNFNELRLESPWRRAPNPGEREGIHVLVEELSVDDRDRHLANTRTA